MKKDSPTLSSKPKSPSVISQARKYIFQKHVGAKNHRMCITSKKKMKTNRKKYCKKNSMYYFCAIIVRNIVWWPAFNMWHGVILLRKSTSSSMFVVFSVIQNLYSRVLARIFLCTRYAGTNFCLGSPLVNKAVKIIVIKQGCSKV